MTCTATHPVYIGPLLGSGIVACALGAEHPARHKGQVAHLSCEWDATSFDAERSDTTQLRAWLHGYQR